MKTAFATLAFLSLLVFSSMGHEAFGQVVVFSENFESGTANPAWGVYYRHPTTRAPEDSVKARPMAQAPEPLVGGGNYVGYLQDRDTSYNGSAVAVSGDVSLKDYSIEADVYCYTSTGVLSAYTGIVVYADSSKRDFYKMRADIDNSNRINFSGLKSDTVTFQPLFNKDFLGADNPGLFPTVDGWHKMKIEVRNTSAKQTSIWCYFDNVLLKGCPIVDTTSVRVTSGRFGLYSFRNLAGVAAYFDNIVVTTLPATSVEAPWQSSVPGDFQLAQNYPNPFNPTTTIIYSVKESDFVSVVVVDQLGRTVRTLVSEKKPAGVHTLSWNGENDHGRSVPSGIYYYTLRTGSVTETRKMTLLR